MCRSDVVFNGDANSIYDVVVSDAALYKFWP